MNVIIKLILVVLLACSSAVQAESFVGKWGGTVTLDTYFDKQIGCGSVACADASILPGFDLLGTQQRYFKVKRNKFHPGQFYLEIDSELNTAFNTESYGRDPENDFRSGCKRQIRGRMGCDEPQSGLIGLDSRPEVLFVESNDTIVKNQDGTYSVSTAVKFLDKFNIPVLILGFKGTISKL